jgi:hypothetical protein
VLINNDFRRLWTGATVSALVTPLLVRDHLNIAAVAMVLIAGLPGFYLILTATGEVPAPGELVAR